MFAGRRFDIEIGLYYNRARYYNPFTGRFLQADPIGYEAGLNLYAYCGNNSLNRVDPSGLWWAGDPNKDAIWMQDYATSCGPATIVNTLWNLYPDGKFPDGSAIPTEEEIRIMFEKIIYPGQTYYSGTDASIWGSQWQANTANNVGGRGVAMKEELTVLNDILSSHNTGKQYKMLIGGQWDLDDIKAGVAKGPVIHAVEWWNGSAHCSMIPKVENGGYWHVNPAWTCAVFSPDDDAVKEYFNMTFTYFNYLVDAWHVPILVPDW
jgi:RHS repeat-associated protein